MPELPEVETIAQILKQNLNNQHIIECKILNSKLRYTIQPDIITKIKNQQIKNIYRKAKFCVFSFEKGVLITHFGMTGTYQLCNEFTQEKHHHIYFKFENQYLIYNDIRKFGYIKWYDYDCYEQLIQSLGVEPLSENFTIKFFTSLCHKSNQPIKQLIMDMKKIVGIGNIYANESLFLTKIHPLTLASKLDLKKIKLLHQNIQTILINAINLGGTTIKNYKSPKEKMGYFSQKLYVYGKNGELCKKCNSTIMKIILQQRSSFYCSFCQKEVE